MCAEDADAAHEFVVRRMQASDVEAISQLFGNFPTAAAWSPTDVKMLAESTGGVAILGEVDGRVVAALLGRCVAGEAEILNIAVSSEWQRQGYAARLARRQLEGWKAQGVEKVYLEVRESNGPAVAFYNKLGFRQTGRRPNYYSNPTEAASLMELVLGSPQ